MLLRMKLFAAIALFAMMAPKDYTAHVYFKHVHIAVMREGRTESTIGTNGEGEGFVLEGDKPRQPFTFTFQGCDRPGKPPEGGFPARWKNPNHLMVLFPSSDGKGDECELKIKPVAM
jgi:hypothetical protein